MILWPTALKAAKQSASQTKMNARHCLFPLTLSIIVLKAATLCQPSLMALCLPSSSLSRYGWCVYFPDSQPLFTEVMLTECSTPLAPSLCRVVVRLSKKEAKGKFEQYFSQIFWGLLELAVRCFYSWLIVFLVVINRWTCNMLSCRCHLAIFKSLHFDFSSLVWNLYWTLSRLICYLLLSLSLQPHVLYQWCLVFQILIVEKLRFKLNLQHIVWREASSTSCNSVLTQSY